MTIELILDLKPALLTCYDDAFAIFLEVWKEQKQPTEAPALVTVLAKTMDRCNKKGIIYPRVFLLRKGQLLRGEFKPRQEMRSMVDPAKIRFASVSHPAIPQEWIDNSTLEWEKSMRDEHERRRRERTEGRQKVKV